MKWILTVEVEADSENEAARTLTSFVPLMLVNSFAETADDHGQPVRLELKEASR